MGIMGPAILGPKNADPLFEVIERVERVERVVTLVKNLLIL